MKKIYTLMLSFCFPLFVQAQNSKNSLINTSDIDRFWIAYDSVQTTKDTIKQKQFVQNLYVEKGSEGLKAFMKARDYSAELWVELINKYPNFWASIRNNTFQVKNQVKSIETSISKLRSLYPEMRPAKMYFTVGGLRSGGTTTDDMVLIGTEIAAADKNTDASELSDWLKNVFKNQDRSNLVYLNVHEYVHTQQKFGGNILLTQCITEGSADFIAELVTEKKNNNVYMLYGRQHELELKEKFKIDMFGSATSNWLYNGTSVPHADLGYFMGYTICSSYYKNAIDKKQAVKNIIELNYGDEQQVFNFLTQSRYYSDPINKEELLKKYEMLLPYIVSLNPNLDSQNNVSATLTELTLNFSQPMGKGISISLGDGGKKHFPVFGVIGFADDHKSFKLKLSLQPHKVYDFVVTGRGFKSQTGYPLKEYKVHFETK